MVVQENARCKAELPKHDAKKHRLKQRFDVRQKLGQGTYGKVQLAVNRESSQEVAIKTIKKSKIENEQDLTRIRREIQIMSSIQHPHIIHIYEVFENKDKIVLVMQFASGGELYNYLNEKKVLPDAEARRIFRQIAAAVYYCHKNKICHRDLKLENILLDEKGNAKIADFGLSNVFDERHLLRTYCGSPLYASPEIVKGVPYYGPEVDCWSMGVLLYTLVYGAMPFGGSNFKKLVTQISEGDYFEPKKKSKASDLIHKLLTVNPLKRATIVDICTDFWVNQGFEHSLLQVAEDMANLTPVRLDLLLALAPGSPLTTTEAQELKEEQFKESSDSEHHPGKYDADDDEDDNNPETAVNSFAFMHGSQMNNLSASSPNLQNVASLIANEEGDTTEDEFLPADLSAACSKRAAERSFDGSLLRVSSTAHKSKKPRKSTSAVKNKENFETADISSQKTNDMKGEEKVLSKESSANIEKSFQQITNDNPKQSVEACSPIPEKATQKETTPQEKPSEHIPVTSHSLSKDWTDEAKRQSIFEMNKENENAEFNEKMTELAKKQQPNKKETRRIGRPPGKIVIPKTFESPQSTPSPKIRVPSSSASSQGSLEEKCDNSTYTEKNSNIYSIETATTKESPVVCNKQEINEDKKTIAKGILKKGIAKAKLAERKLSQQGSLDSEVTPTSSIVSPEMVPSFYKAPKPYCKEEEQQQQVKSRAEITLSPSSKLPDIVKSTEVNSSTPLWDSASISSNQKPLDEQNLSWGTMCNLDSEMSNWREQMEESLKRLSPDSEIGTAVTPLNKSDDDQNLVPIARSYKKFTFTKDGACITETKKIYTAPCPDGSWTKVEKKTKITTRPGNAEEFEKFRDLHLKNDSHIAKSDSQSSSGSNDVYDDIFDSWTGDSMMCNMMKIRDVFQKFSKDPFLRSDRRRNPFQNFRRTESDRNDRYIRKGELKSCYSTDKDSSDNEDDVIFESSSPIVYGTQGLWQFLKSSNQRLNKNVAFSQPNHEHYSRSISQDRNESKLSNWRNCESGTSSGYNTGSRSRSRDKTQSPRENVLRFVVESNPRCQSPPKRDSLYFRRAVNRHEPRRDSGINSDGYESEHSFRCAPSDGLLKNPRVSPMTSIYGCRRQGIISDFVKPWPKESMSPLRHDIVSDTTDNRQHKVEQWLNMNSSSDSTKFFGISEPYSRMAAARKSSMHDNVPSTYATIRPRDYTRYNIRSSNDKICSENIDCFSPIDSLKCRTRASTYSPLSEESNRTTHLHHSDSSSSSTHHINFTFSDGRAPTSQTSSPLLMNRRPESFGTLTGDIGTGRCYGQPVVQMKVSFNRGNADNRVLHISSQSPAVGLWQHQDNHATTSIKLPSGAVNSGVNPETSPIPGIKKFSTEMVHTVGNSLVDQSGSKGSDTVEFEVKTTVKNSGGVPKGKNQVQCNETQFVSCPSLCMKNSLPNNINLSPSLLLTPNLVDSCDPEIYTLPPIAMFPQLIKDVNTPDSLEDPICDANVDEEVLTLLDNYVPITSSEESYSYTSGLPLDIKPVGVLWDNYQSDAFQQASNFPNNSQVCPCSTSPLWNNGCPSISSKISRVASPNLSDSNQRCKSRNSSSEVGSIWEQRTMDDNQNESYELLKDIFHDNALDNLRSIHGLTESSAYPGDNNNTITTEKVATKSPLSVLDEFAFLEEYAVADDSCKKFGPVMPSLMDDLQSPQQVLHQALRISKSLKSCE